MSSKARSDLCRICGGDLQGNQRRWLFGGQKKGTGQPRTPSESVRGGGLSRSSQSSPWGSTVSLGSSGSLSQLSAGPQSKAVDLLAVLTHILGRPVERGATAGEFTCGKCASALERVFRFDAVIARVKVLSNERLQKLTKDRDHIRVWIRHNYQTRHPQSPPTGEEDGETEKEGYREMLRDNMSLSGYEWWSDRWDTCPFFIRTGKRCRKGKGCEGCNSLRVSDSDYESVCGVPRHLPFSPLGLSRDKSQSMPLHWQGVPSVHSSPASLAGSSLSLRGSVQSLDSVDGPDPFDSPADLSFLLKKLRRLEGKPVSSPSGSRIPVLDRRSEGSTTPRVCRFLSYEDSESPRDQVDGEDGDVLTELREEYMPLHRASATTRVHSAMKHLRAQLDQATSRIRTLEAELRGGGGGGGGGAEVNGSEDLASEDSFLLPSFCHSLRSRERLIQECLGLIRGLCVQDGAGVELSSKLTENLKEILSDNKAALHILSSELMEKQKNLQEEVEALRKAGRDREADLDLLNTVLQNNQDLVNDLRAALEEKEHRLKEVEKERELWRQRDTALAAVLKEKEVLIQNLQQKLDTKTPSSSVIGQQPSGGRADGEENAASLCQEVSKLTAALQAERETHSQTVSSLTARLTHLQQELRDKQKEKKEAERRRQNLQADGERQERKLRDDLMKRDKLIEQILLDAEERDHLFQELQQNLQNKREPVTAVKHTL